MIKTDVVIPNFDTKTAHVTMRTDIPVAEILAWFGDDDLIKELKRRNYDAFADHATDGEIEDAYEFRDLNDGMTNSDCRLQLENSGFNVIGPHGEEEYIKLAESIATGIRNRGNVSQLDLIVLLEKIVYTPVFSKKELEFVRD